MSTLREIFDVLKQDGSVFTKHGVILAGVLCILIGLSIGLYGSWFVFSERLKEQDRLIARYRVALGIDPARKGALVELTNHELRAKASGTASHLRELCFTHRKRIDEVQAQADVDAKTKFNQKTAFDTEFSQVYAKDYRADTTNVDLELRRRLVPKTVTGIIGITPPIFSNFGTRIDILQPIPPGIGFDVFYLCILADGIDQMARLLAAD
jgi:hypothetical protein